MSDTEEQGAFDKEAEKEKLREQLRREEENRRSTQHMSELLLKGATMTNKHCDTCGDPLFRYEGREFCPTCAREEGREAGDVEAAAASAATREADGPGEPDPGGASAAEPAGIDRVDAGTRGGRADAGSAPVAEPAGPGDEGHDDVGAARAALARKLSTLARQAEATDDVGRARELLAAAREAAEALAAIDALGG